MQVAIGLLLARVTVGAFFAIAGFHKLFNRDRHGHLVETLKADNIPLLTFNAWFVPLVEFFAGVLLTLGVLSTLSALLLGAVCLVALCVDCIPHVRERWHPVDVADFIDDVLYSPETLLGVLLLVTLLCGPGEYSLDYFVQTHGG
jgi:uncharacterized membrane protein YphA (DoxX/SURF4 family)